MTGDEGSGETVLRGIYSGDEEQLSTFKKGVPDFDTVAECMEWARDNCKYGSNPDDPKLQHIFTHLFDWTQVSKYLLPKLAQLTLGEFDKGGEKYYYTFGMPSENDEVTDDEEDEDDDEGPSSGLELKSRFTRQNRAATNFEFKPAKVELERRLDLSFHKSLNYASTLNTLNYLFNHMRCGIFVAIRQNEVAMFVPFVNRDYRNNWGHNLTTDPADFDEYYKLKLKFYRKENVIPDKTRWWANGNILCNEHHAPRETYTHYWGDNLLPTFKHMLETMCRERRIPDVDFFFNKRDHPQLKANKTEPYDFVFDEKDRPLERENYESYCPILSFYCSPKFADIPVPTTEDWESAMGRVFPPSFIPDYRSKKLQEPRDLYLKENFQKFHVEWEDKKDTAFFRGNATGGGTTPETNQRIHVAQICQEWKRSGVNRKNPPLLDAGITNYNVRDKKLFGQPMRFTRKSELGVSKADFVEMYKQGTYKYILYIEGHCAANRYSFLMRLGSVILKVESTCEASEMWFFPFLNPYLGSLENNIDVQKGVMGADHVPVKADLSNLQEQIEWCRANDDKCRQIAENAKNKYQRCLTKDSLLDYMQLIMVKIAKQYEHPPKWWSAPEPLAPKPSMEPPSHSKCSRDNSNGQQIYCRRCKMDLGDKNRDDGPGRRKRKHSAV
eukprot:CAMPEP_0203747012 /NCGR_PEP_ID=MMETSP0098-20131031/2271_1 /ASSEMBLY_ACC=CAM_ASM_000208 /TAXON_ID=96639 /ORGANISM=" , Strain NY0313808BC1" /LENGTH=667 /DNA_ID=CAMNT_0050635293 /DNA_START=2757 /DNA_END=4760 /DNA_ORIENTATION=+